MILFLLNIWGYIVSHWRIFALGAGIVLLVIFMVTTFKSCGRKASIDQESINKINRGNEVERKTELKAVIEKNQEVVTSVDNRTTIAETHVAEQNAAIDQKIKVVDAKIVVARQQGKDITAEELEALLLGTP